MTGAPPGQPRDRRGRFVSQRTDQAPRDNPGRLAVRASLDQIATALAAIQAARDYGFDDRAPLDAVVDQVENLDRPALIGVVAALALFVGRDLVPRAGLDFDHWLEANAFALALRDSSE